MTILLGPHLAHLKARGRKPSTIEQRAYWLDKADRATDAERVPYFEYGIDEATTREWLAYLSEQTWSAATRATTYGHYAGFYRWATSGYDPPLDWNPFADIERPAAAHSLPDPVSDDELEYAVGSSDDWWRFVIILAAEAGLRRAEIVNLRREDVNEERIRVRDSKGGRSREVPTSTELWQIIEPCRPGLLVRSPTRGVPISPHRMGMLARHHFDEIDLPEVHLHRFRHWFGTKLIALGVDLSIVSKLMGHASVATTMLYVLITGGQRRLAIDTLPTLNGHPSESPSTGQIDMISSCEHIGGTLTACPIPIGDLPPVGHR